MYTTRIPRYVLVAVSIGFLLAAPVEAQTVTVIAAPAVHTGAGSINPEGRGGTGFFQGLADIPVFQALAGYGTVQDFSTVVPASGTFAGKTFVVDYDSGVLRGGPDVRFVFDNNAAGSTAVTSGTYLTSTGSGLRLQTGSSNTLTLTISFGTWNGTVFECDQGVSAAGFTLGGTFANATGGTVTVSYYNSGNMLLDGQRLTSTDGQTAIGSTQNRWAFTGWQNSSGNPANDIASITVSFTANNTATIIALDDFGFAARAAMVPEPAGVTVLSGIVAVALGLARMFSRKRH
jgi:hypothetical protein